MMIYENIYHLVTNIYPNLYASIRLYTIISSNIISYMVIYDDINKKLLAKSTQYNDHIKSYMILYEDMLKTNI